MPGEKDLVNGFLKLPRVVMHWIDVQFYIDARLMAASLRAPYVKAVCWPQA